MCWFPPFKFPGLLPEIIPQGIDPQSTSTKLFVYNHLSKACSHRQKNKLYNLLKRTVAETCAALPVASGNLFSFCQPSVGNLVQGHRKQLPQDPLKLLDSFWYIYSLPHLDFIFAREDHLSKQAVWTCLTNPLGK